MKMRNGADKVSTDVEEVDDMTQGMNHWVPRTKSGNVGNCGECINDKLYCPICRFNGGDIMNTKTIDASGDKDNIVIILQEDDGEVD